MVHAQLGTRSPRSKVPAEEWASGRAVSRMWARDASLWTGQDEARWLGWLDVADSQLARLDVLRRFAVDVRTHGFSHALLLGMGGSSLAAEVLRQTFGTVPGHPDLCVLDSTDPVQVRDVEGRVDLDHTLFIVASKTGTTLESDILAAHFLARAGGRSRFVAVTDPGSPLQRLALERRFWAVFSGVPEIGGRFSALSDFGMIPAAAMGLDVEALLRGALQMARDCGPGVPPAENPGVVLGSVLGGSARSGLDKLTLIISPPLASLGAWLEQLVAESTGKDGVGIIPVDGEAPATPGSYGGDRLFAYVRLRSGFDPAQDAFVAALEAAGRPVVTLRVDGLMDLGREFFRWECATAVAGSLLGVNPFTQPDVDASKSATRALTDAVEVEGVLPPEGPALAACAVGVDDAALVPRLWSHLGSLRRGDYLALLAYLPMRASHQESLAAIRHAVRDATRAATCVGFGPRFLHSTGQAHKGGPNSGVFLQLTCSDAEDLPVPGRHYTFGLVKEAQSRGDLSVLLERERRVLHVRLGADVGAGLERLEAAVAEALDALG